MKWITTCVLLFVAQVTLAQYKVLKVIGEIRLTKNNAQVTQGMTLSPDDDLIFGGASSKASLIFPGKGRVNALGSKANKNTQGQLKGLLKDVLVAPDGSSLNHRGQITNTEQLTTFFTASNDKEKPGKFLIIGKGEYLLQIDDYPLGEKQFFFISYQYKEETINKKLAFEEKTFFIDSDIYKVDGEPIEREEISEMKLLYADMKDGNKVLIANIDPVFAEEETLTEEVKTVLEGFPKASPEEIFKKHVYGYLAEFYGQPDPAQLKQFLKEKVGISVE